MRAVAHVETDDTIVVGKDGVNFKRADGAVYLKPFSDASLRARVQQHAAFTKYDARAEKDVPCDCPRSDQDRYGLRGELDRSALRAVISAPTLRGDGSVISEPGFDARTGLLLVTDRLWRGIPDKPTRRDAAAAIDVLVKPISEFPYVADSDPRRRCCASHHLRDASGPAVNAHVRDFRTGRRHGEIQDR